MADAHGSRSDRASASGRVAEGGRPAPVREEETQADPGAADAPLLRVENLVKRFEKGGGWLSGPRRRVYAVNGISLNIERGEVLGVVGESGCGKSTLGKCILRLIPPTSGRVLFDGVDVTAASPRELRTLRRRMQMVFQDPYSSLNPRMTARAMLREVLAFHGTVPRERIDQRVVELLEDVELGADALHRFPHEFSGGQRQRLNIARALAVDPDFVVADEPVSALDVSVQAQILNLLQDLQRKRKLTLLFISHDLKVVEHVCDRVMVVYRGFCVEEIAAERLYDHAVHPYTRALLEAIPPDDPCERKEPALLRGDVPSPSAPVVGCPFVARCPIAEPRCREENPPLESHEAGHRVACWAVGAAHAE